MRLLKITLIAVGLLVILKIVEIVLSKYSHLTLLFHLNLLKALQLLVLGWLILALLFTLIMKKRQDRALRLATLLVLFVSLVFEIVFGYLLQHPSRIPRFMLSSF